jgi:AcrR family transcriptional regulator
VTQTARPPSARQAELLERAYGYVLTRGLTGLSLRPLAAAIGSSPRVLLFLFGSKEGLIRAILGRARADELAFLARARAQAGPPGASGLADAVRVIWQWLAADGHRRLLTLWVEAYGRSLTEPDGPWADFARQTVTDWLAVLADAQPPGQRDTPAGAAERTLALAVLRGALLDLLATGDAARTASAISRFLGPPP